MVGIKEAITEEYPLVNTEQGMNIVITPQGVNQAPGASLLRFTSIDSHWSVVLSNEFVSLETREYTNFEEFSTRFARILHHVAIHFRPRYQLRVGLRYINEFRHANGDSYDTWRRLLNPKLLGLIVGNVIEGNVEQTIGEILTHRDDGRVLIRHGFLKGTTVTPTAMHPAKTSPFYLLDLDYYDETVVKFDVEVPIERIKRYNNFLYRIFRWSIGEGEFYQLMRR
jgi:uncharacterized protein (TIGR04255 family)